MAGILAYGVLLGTDMPFPGMIGHCGLEDKCLECYNNRYNPKYLFDDWLMARGMSACKGKSTYLSAKFCPVDVLEVGHDTHPIFFLCLRGFTQTVSLYEIAPIDLKDFCLTLEKDAEEFCKEYGITWAPQWHLMSTN